MWSRSRCGVGVGVEWQQLPDQYYAGLARFGGKLLILIQDCTRK